MDIITRKGARNFIVNSEIAKASPERATSSQLIPILSRNSCRALVENNVNKKQLVSKNKIHLKIAL